MSVEAANCILEVCCGGNDGKQQRAFAEMLELNVPGLNKREAKETAAWLCSEFDFAPKGSLFEFKQAVARLARGHDYE